jgi:hypothetical protein
MSEMGLGRVKMRRRCENAKTLNRDRRSYSSKTALVAQGASGLNLEIGLKNIILRCVSIFEFLHGRGHSRRFDRTTATFGLPPATDTVSAGRQVCFGPAGDVKLSYSITSPDRRLGTAACSSRARVRLRGRSGAAFKQRSKKRPIMS